MDDERLFDTLKSIEQESLNNQILNLIHVATHEGLNDAVDWIILVRSRITGSTIEECKRQVDNLVPWQR